jgi:hypothetical protein
MDRSINSEWFSEWFDNMVKQQSKLAVAYREQKRNRKLKKNREEKHRVKLRKALMFNDLNES